MDWWDFLWPWWCIHTGCVLYRDRDRDWNQNNGGLYVSAAVPVQVQCKRFYIKPYNPFVHVSVPETTSVIKPWTLIVLSNVILYRTAFHWECSEFFSRPRTCSFVGENAYQSTLLQYFVKKFQYIARRTKWNKFKLLILSIFCPYFIMLVFRL